MRKLRVTLMAGLFLVAFLVSGPAQTIGGPSSPARQELRVGFIDDTYILEGERASLGMFPLNANILESLTSLNSKYEVKPLLAERWEFRPPNTWRFFLRRGVQFHNGQPFTARAVKEMFNRIARRPGGGGIKAGPDSTTIVDDFTVDFTPLVPNIRIPEQLVTWHYHIRAPGSEIGQGRRPIGTGPFRFVQYLRKERIIVERNPSYWGPKAKLERIVFSFFPDSSARRLALEAGNIDFAFEVPRPDVKSLKAKGFKIVTSSVGTYRALYANVRSRAPYDLLADVRLRRAIAHSIDRKKLVTGVLEGLATTDQTMVPPSVLGNFAFLVQGFSYDAAKARALLDEAGWRPGSGGIREKGGRRLKLVLVSGYPVAELHRPVPAFLQAELKEVGIEIEIVERPDIPSYQALINSGEGDLYLEEGNQSDANPGFLPYFLFYTGGDYTVYQRLFGPGQKFDELLAPSLTEVEMSKVRKAVAEAMHEIIDEQAVVIPLVGLYRIYSMKKSVQGFLPHPVYFNVRWDTVSLAD